MFRATFLGHQGWLVSSGVTSVLIDPLLTNGFGHGGMVGDMYPPRNVDMSRLPRVDAVFITHEHDDHLDFATLAALDPNVPLFLSARSSVAAWEALGALGFEMRALEPDSTVTVGDLRYRTLVTDHRPGTGGDEWDVLPYVVEDAGGHGSLFSTVDVAPDPRALAQLASSPPGIWAYACNASAPAYASRAPSDDTEILATVLARRFKAVAAAWGGAPKAAAIIGSGWSFPGERAWLNRRVFPIEIPRLASLVAGELGEARIRATVPGESITMVRGAVVAWEAASRFMSAKPSDQWPDRSVDEGGRPPNVIHPATPVRGWGGQSEALAAAEKLSAFAEYLYGRRVFRELHSVAEQSCDGLRISFCFALRPDDGGAPEIVAYEPRSCGFRVCAETKADDYISGYACFGRDLAAFLDGEIGPSALCNTGRLRVWNRVPDVLRVSSDDLWVFGHPLRRPAAHRRLYARLCASVRGSKPHSE